MGCPICGVVNPGDRDRGIMEDDCLCPACFAKGWEECGCRIDDDTNEFVACEEHGDRRGD
jgi:hypothetical protein